MDMNPKENSGPGRIPRVGDPAPLVDVIDLNGRAFTLGSHPESLAIVFMRHLA